MAIRKDNEPWQKFDADGPVLALVTHGPTLMENVEVHVLLGKEMARLGLAYLHQGLQPLTTALICRCSLTCSSPPCCHHRYRHRHHHYKQPLAPLHPAKALPAQTAPRLLLLCIVIASTPSLQSPDSLISSYHPMLIRLYGFGDLQCVKQVKQLSNGASFG
uniref:Uncharacterized protein n=1 Tax=Oryza meridionalis TaxID=40149 RepID=A0A0E0E360_9ORYZ